MRQPETVFTFNRHVPMRDVEGTLRLARLAAESLHGQDRVALESATAFKRSDRKVAIDTSTEVGRTLAAVFLGYARREFGADVMQIKQLTESACHV